MALQPQVTRSKASPRSTDVGMNVQSSADVELYHPNSLASPIMRYVSHEFQIQHNQICRSISLVLTADEVLQFYDNCRTFPKEEVFALVESHRRDVASRPTPEQLSLLVQRLANSLATSPAVGGMVELPSGATNSFNSDSDCSSHSLETAQPSPAPPSKQICIACDISCANLRALRLHEREFCERELDWFCPDCPNQTFGRHDRLSRHHYDVHSATCHHLLDYCKQVLAKCSRQAAAKKVWGCPCCLRCFETLETWNQHKAIHRTHNGKVENWSFSTMFGSLLRHRDLSTVYDRYDWKSRTWAGRGKAECQILRTALERHVLPSNLLSLQTYSRLTLPESLALYAYSLSTPRTIDAAPTIELQIQTAVDPPPFYRDPPVEQCTAFQSIDLNCQPEGHLAAATNLESDEHGRPLSNFVALEEASDQEECDKRILQVRLASGTTKLYIPQGDHESAPQHPQQPNILAAYAASRRNCNRTLQVPRRRRSKCDGRTPIGKQLHPKPDSRSLHRGGSQMQNL